MKLFAQHTDAWQHALRCQMAEKGKAKLADKLAYGSVGQKGSQQYSYYSPNLISYLFVPGKCEWRSRPYTGCTFAGVRYTLCDREFRCSHILSVVGFALLELLDFTNGMILDIMQRPDLV